MRDHENETASTDAHSSAIDGLSGPQKAAAILVAIGRPAASRLLKHFNADDLRSLAGHARTLAPISPVDFEHLVKTFEDAFADGAPVSEAGQRFEGLIREVLPEDEIAAVFDERPAPKLIQETVWVQIARMPAETLNAYLAEQHPQIIAYVVSKLPSDIAARLFVSLPASLRSAVVQRSLHIGTVTAEAETMLEDVLRRDLIGRTDAGPVRAHHGHIANIFNQLDRFQIDDMLTSLTDIGREDMARIKAQLFTFEDIERLSQRARLLVFDEVATGQIAIALRDTQASLRELVLSSLSARGRRMVETELAADPGNITAQAVTDARRAIARIAINLAARNMISLETEQPAG